MGKEYNGMYLGIVIQNDDPDRSGKVKVYVPHVIASVYDNWVQTNDDKAFKFPGNNIDSDLNTILEPLKSVLPWAECAMPLVGASGSGRYNAHKEDASISDTSKLQEFAPDEDYVSTKYSLNQDGIGESPGAKYEKFDLRLVDAFTDSENNDNNQVNVLGNNYVPNTYSNMAKGSFCIPNVGSHVWCFFKDGSTDYPVYFAASYGEQDWQSIYDLTADDRGTDYPGTYENTGQEADQGYSTDTETYRNKFVINQKGGVLEFINTDNREILKLTHYSGSFKEFNNYANIELASANDQKLVLEDQFETVRGFKSSYVERDYDFIVRGDRFKKIGNLNQAAMAQWRNVMGAIADIKQLFDVKRANLNDWTSELQNQSGSFGPCPVCSPSSSRSKKYPQLLGEWKSVAQPPPIVDMLQYKHEPSRGVSVEPKNYSPAGMAGGSNGKIFGESCPACGGSGRSKSTMDGIWTPDEKKQQDRFDRAVIDAVETLVDVERDLGLGGSEDIHITKHKIETIGMVMNDFGSIRTDTVGKMFSDKMVIHKQGVFESRKETPLIEYVHVDDLPGGTYTLNVCNKYNVQVGAGGLSMKSYGPVDISGTIVNTTGEQVNISSANEVNIDGGSRLNIIADIIAIRQRKHEQVLIDSSAGISRNLIVGGSSHFEGEVYLHHVTAPTEIQETENTKIFGRADHEETKIIGYSWNGIPCDIPGCSYEPIYSRIPDSAGNPCVVADHDSIYMYPHSHHFKNLPLHLKNTHDDVRSAAKECNSSTRGKAKQREWVNAENKSKPKRVPPGKSGGFGGLGGGLGSIQSAASQAMDQAVEFANSDAGKMMINASTGGMGGPLIAAGTTLAQGGSLEEAAGSAAGEALGGAVPGGIPGVELNPSTITNSIP